MLTTIEQTALSNLIHNEDYARKVLPFLKGDYFSDRIDRVIFEEIANTYKVGDSKYMDSDIPTDGRKTIIKLDR